MTSTTACWATNKEFDCAWFYYGYGSRHDMMSSYGYWLSLEGACILAEYDYEYLKPKYGASFYVQCLDHDERRFLESNGYDLAEAGEIEISVNALPPKMRMDKSAIRVIHPSGLQKSLEWFEIVNKVSGKYQKQCYTEQVVMDDVFSGPSYVEFRIPSLKKIQEINQYHYDCHVRVEMMEKNCNEMMRIREKYLEKWGDCIATPEQIQEMLVQWDDEKEVRYQDFKAKNIWEQL